MEIKQKWLLWWHIFKQDSTQLGAQRANKQAEKQHEGINFVFAVSVKLADKR